MAVVEDALIAMDNAGIEPVEATRGFYSLVSYTVGSVAVELGVSSFIAKWDVSEPDAIFERSVAWLRAEPHRSFSHLIEFAPHLATFLGDDQFEYGLKRLIAGLKR